MGTLPTLGGGNAPFAINTTDQVQATGANGPAPTSEE